MEHFDLAAFYGGSATELYRTLGAHRTPDGWVFRVWAPHAGSVSVVGDFCAWDPTAHPMRRFDGGVWETEVAGLSEYDTYKFAVTAQSGAVTFKADPYAFHAETRPGTASKLYELAGYDWGDGAYLAAKQPVYDRPLNIYEVHLGSWRRRENGDFYDYRSLADELSEYAADLGYNCVELMPVTEYPLDDSWGYQCTGYFAATSRYGTPDDLKYLVDCLHAAGLAVILDWVPSHFCKDAHGLMDFDGTSLYEYADPLKREHDGWGTRVFDFGRPEVRSFLLSSALWWLEEFRMDGLRVDAVASMLYLDYGRAQWRPNGHGGHENLEAIEFLRLLNETVHREVPRAVMIAEESTAWPGVTKPADEGGLGFDWKWNMGWMNDLCQYLKTDPIYRQYHHNNVNFSMMYAFSERYILPISHDEVVHMKGSLRGKMPGDDWKQLAGVRGFWGYMLAHPGRKLTFMGAELGQWHEWDFRGQLDWYLLDRDDCARTHACIRALNRFYLEHPALWDNDEDWDGFSWLVADDRYSNVLVFQRTARDGRSLICAVNFAPLAWENYRFGVSGGAQVWHEVFNTDELRWGGSGVCNAPVTARPEPSHGKDYSLTLRLPPLGTVFLEAAPAEKQKDASGGVRQ